MSITPYLLDDFDVDPETKRVLGVALEKTRVSLGLADDLPTESSPSDSSNLPSPSLAWQHAFATLTPTTTLTLRNTGAAFGIWGVPIARDAALIEAGGDLQLSAQTKVGIFYLGACAKLLLSGPANTRCSVRRFNPGGVHS